MNNDEILARFGISKKLAHGLFVQSILVIFATIISIWGIFEVYYEFGFTFKYITNFLSLLVCISLLIYSFYGFNAKKNQEAFFTSAIVLYILLIISGLLTSAFNYTNPVSILTIVTLIAAVHFLYAYTKNYKSANYAMLLVLISVVIVMIFNMMGGMPWFIALKYLIIPCSIALTYFERVQRGKYDLL